MRPLNSIFSEPVDTGDIAAIVEERRSIVTMQLDFTPLAEARIDTLLDLVFLHKYDNYIVDPWYFADDFGDDLAFCAQVASALARHDWHLGSREFLPLDIRANDAARAVIAWRERRLAA